MGTETDRRRVPDVLLERYRLGELPAAQVQDIDAALGRDAAARDRLDAIAADDAAQHAARLPHRIVVALRQRQHDRASAAHASRWQTISVAAAAATLLVAVVATVVRQPPVPVTSVDDGDRIKGAGPAIVAFRKAGNTSEVLHDGDAAREHDVIRLGYQAAGPAFGAIVSIDGRGTVTQHLPASGTRAAALASTGRVLLDAAYELDDAPRWERFCLVTGNRPFELAAVLDAARASARAGTGAFGVPSLDVTCLTLRKDQ